MLREGPMILVEANEVALLCHGVQIIIPHMIQIMEVIRDFRSANVFESPG